MALSNQRQILKKLEKWLVPKRLNKKICIIQRRIYNIVKQLKVKVKSSVIREKGESQNGCFKKTKHVKFSEKRTFFTTWYAQVRAYQGIENVRFLKNLACFVFLKHPFWDSPFCLIADEVFDSFLNACL